MSSRPEKPSEPCYAVIFTSRRTPGDQGYDAMAGRMEELAAEQPGFLGIESARGADGFGITISYWRSVEELQAWKQVAEHRGAQQLGRERWYTQYRVRVARVDWAYEYEFHG